MMLRKNRSRELSRPEASASSAAQTNGWTNGSALGSWGFTVLLVVAIACGPVALGVATLSGGPSTAAPRPEQTKPPSPLRQSTGAFAIGYVGAWLSATQDDATALEAYSNTSAIQLSKLPFQYRNIAVASTTDTGGDLLQVTVAADLKDETILPGDGDQWPRRYFQVTVLTASDTLTAIGLPAPMAGPPTVTAAPQLDYSETIASTSAAGTTVSAFLGAYLTGQGATQPYTAPATEIPGIEPAPYSSVTVASIQVASSPADHPRDGDTLQVYAAVTAANAAGQQATSNYVLNLRARADRWEVAAVGVKPALATTDSPPTPEPSGTSNTEGKQP